MGGSRVLQVFFLCGGLGVLIIAAGVTYTFLPIILYELGFSAWTCPALIGMCSDPLSQFAFLSIPITVPADIFGMEYGFTAQDLAPMLGPFFFVTLPGYALGALWMLRMDGVKILRRHVLLALAYGKFRR